MTVFEALIAEGKAAGTGWKLTNGRTVHCQDGRCILGAVIHARAKAGTLPLEKMSSVTPPSNPDEEEAALLLGITQEEAIRVIIANDGNDDAFDPLPVLKTGDRDRQYLLDQLGLTATEED